MKRITNARRARIVGKPKVECFAFCYQSEGLHRCDALGGDVITCIGCRFYKTEEQHRKDAETAKKRSALETTQHAQIELDI